jgi:aquaporin TIP
VLVSILRILPDLSSISQLLTAPDSEVTMALSKIAWGRTSEATSIDALKAALAEFIAMFLFVFLGVGSCISYAKIHDGDLEPAGLVAIAIAHGLGIVITVAATANISGGHVNPAVTFGLAIGGHITILRGALYWVAQLLGSVAASYTLLAIIVPGQVIPPHALGDGVSPISGLVLEIVLTFALVFVVYATAVDPKKGSIGIVAPLAIGFTVLAAHFIGVPYTGASLNPARSFGPAFVTMTWANQWIYWAGPLIGATIAAVVYGEIFLSPASHSPIHDEF